jgi:apolipoprotein N-acyltransferase
MPGRSRPIVADGRTNLWPVLPRTGLAALAGVLLAAAYAPVDVPWVIPVAVAVYVSCVGPLRPRRAWVPGLAFGIGFQFALLWWMRVIGTDAWAGLAGIEALFYGLLGALVPMLRRWPAWPLLVAIAWMTMDSLRMGWPFSGMPWGRLSYGVADHPWSQALPYVGFSGLDLVLALVGALLAALVLDRSRWRPTAALAVLVAGVSFVPALVPYDPPVSGQRTVAVVQGNVPGDGTDVLVDIAQLTRNHLDATEDLATDVDDGRVPAPDFVVWPENSTATDPFSDPLIGGMLDAASERIGVPLLAGVMADSGAHGVLNQGIVWNPGVGPGDRYTKHHPVPFGEYVPWRSLFAGNLARIQKVPRDMLAGTRQTPLRIAGVLVADAICFDVAYDDSLHDQIVRGGQLVVVQTSNASFIYTHQIDQQFEISRLRAMEAGRDLVVASTNGVTGVIRADGSVVARSPLRRTDVLVEKVNLSDALTLGLRIDGWTGRAVWPLVALLILIGALAYRRRTAPGPTPAEGGEETSS